MWKEVRLVRFLGCMKLLEGFLLVLVLRDNLLLLYLGWEGVGMCSYHHIGFWYKNPSNGYAARKAFIVTRVGDAAMAVGFYILFMTFHTLDIQEILQSAPEVWTAGSGWGAAAAFLLLGGAVGKSARKSAV